MKTFVKLLLPFWLLSATFQNLHGQVLGNSLWGIKNTVLDPGVSPVPGSLSVQNLETSIFELDFEALRALLIGAPLRQAGIENKSNKVLQIPLPNGALQSFQIYEAPVMHPDLGKKFPEIRSYAGYGIEDRSAFLRFSVSPRGFSAIILSGKNKTVVIDPVSQQSAKDYQVVFKVDSPSSGNWVCQTDSEDGFSELENNPNLLREETLARAGDCKTRTYQLAMACTGEFTAFHGGTVALGLAAINATVTRINAVYELDLSVHLQLVANNNLIVYTNAATDPYTNGNTSAMVAENQTNLDKTTVIGSANYDIGHVSGTGSGGYAPGRVCKSTTKAQGATCAPQPTGDAFDIDYVAHEMGHQFSATHTQYNDCNRVDASAYEPGSGSTIMGYASTPAICNPAVQGHSDAYFHAINLTQIGAYVKSTAGNACATQSSTHTAPVAKAGKDYKIPKSTPFVLTAATGSTTGNAITYCWEQMDNALGGTQPPTNMNTVGPVFRSLTPSVKLERYFPNLTAILTNFTPIWEVLPNVGRVLNFRLTVRDNVAGNGCTDDDNMKVTVAANSGPFVVLQPNMDTTNWAIGSQRTVTWDVASTNLSPVLCSKVQIMLSTDGGQTYTTLVASTNNDGSHTLTVPNSPTAAARIRVQGYNNIFFDVSDHNFSICAAGSQHTVSNQNTAWTQTGQRQSTWDVSNLTTMPMQVVGITVMCWNNLTTAQNVGLTAYHTTTATTSVGNALNPGAWSTNSSASFTMPGTPSFPGTPVPYTINLASPVTIGPGSSKGFSVFSTLQYAGGPIGALSGGAPYNNGEASVLNGILQNGAAPFTSTNAGGFQFYGTIAYNLCMVAAPPENVEPSNALDEDIFNQQSQLVFDGQEMGLKIYPNPTATELNVGIEASGSIESNVQMAVFDLMGRNLLERSVNISGPDTTTVLDLTTFLPGIYTLTIRSEKGTQAVKFVKSAGK